LRLIYQSLRIKLLLLIRGLLLLFVMRKGLEVNEVFHAMGVVEARKAVVVPHLISLPQLPPRPLYQQTHHQSQPIQQYAQPIQHVSIPNPAPQRHQSF
jgi:hypothetical protein